MEPKESKEKLFTPKLAKLIDVKTIVTFIFVVVYNYMAIVGKIDMKGYETIVLMLISFYFGTQVAKKLTD